MLKNGVSRIAGYKRTSPGPVLPARTYCQRSMIPDLSAHSLLTAYRAKSLTPREVFQDLWKRDIQDSDSRIWISRPEWNRTFEGHS